MEKERKETIVKIVTAALLLIADVAIEKLWGPEGRLSVSLAKWQLLILYLIPYLLVGWETIREAVEGLVHGEALNEDFLMSIATIGALCIGFVPGGESQFPEAVFVMLFFQIGELFEDIAEGQSRRSVASLMEIRPDTATVKREGKVEVVSPDQVKVGETIVIRPGERVPMDGEVLEGNSSLDTVALTGESVPRSVAVGDSVISGCVNLSGLLEVRTTKSFGESTAAKILELVENASENKSRSENFIRRFAKVYTPIVVAAAVLLAVVPPIFAGEWVKWLYRALCFLVVSCPCALVISVPLSFFAGIGGASRHGILVKGSNWLEALAKVGSVVFDKTGTLTKGVFQVTAVHPEMISERELLHMAAHVERFSTHPIAVSLKNAYSDEADACEVGEVEEVAGQGVRARVNGKRVCVGNEKMMKAIGAEWKPCELKGTIIHVAIDGEYVGHIVISDVIKADSKAAVDDLHRLGVRRTVMLTGAREQVVADVASKLGLDEYHADLLPADKVGIVESLLKGKASGDKGKLAFVGDGINDAPVLARADVGIAMGALGSDAAIEAADVVLMDDKPSKIAVAIRIARRTRRIAGENTWFAIGVKVAVLGLASVGLAGMWLAVFADVGVTVLAVLNAMRNLNYRQN